MSKISFAQADGFSGFRLVVVNSFVVGVRTFSLVIGSDGFLPSSSSRQFEATSGGEGKNKLKIFYMKDQDERKQGPKFPARCFSPLFFFLRLDGLGLSC
jgi:hypothetical protein